jgi:ABC-type thiamine transport system ATPase subunit
LGELFDTHDPAFVERYLDACLLLNWYESSCQSSIQANIQVSGGERNRLTLAYHIFLAEKRGSPVLILDECEQGTDLYDPVSRQDCYELVRRIRALCADKTLLIVSHMYDERGRPHLPVDTVDWSHIITMESMQMNLA